MTRNDDVHNKHSTDIVSETRFVSPRNCGLPLSHCVRYTEQKVKQKQWKSTVTKCVASDYYIHNPQLDFWRRHLLWATLRQPYCQTIQASLFASPIYFTPLFFPRSTRLFSRHPVLPFQSTDNNLFFQRRRQRQRREKERRREEGNQGNGAVYSLQENRDPSRSVEPNE